MRQIKNAKYENKKAMNKRKLQDGGKVRQIQTDTHTPFLYTCMDKTLLKSGGNSFCRRCWPSCCKRRCSIATFFCKRSKTSLLIFLRQKRVVLIYTHLNVRIIYFFLTNNQLQIHIFFSLFLLLNKQFSL